MPENFARLTTDTPQNNLQTMLNYAYAKDGEVVLRYGEGQDNINLCEYISKTADLNMCNVTPDQVHDGCCMECDCVFGILFAVATQAAELRERLKRYEDQLDRGDVAEVQHGEWEEERWCDNFQHTCSLCHRTARVHPQSVAYKYCPYCGAKMDGKADDAVLGGKW